MLLRVIMGRAGTGKTRRCLEEIHKESAQQPLGPALILLVPAQATFNMERELAFRGGGMRAQVYSFRRLAHRVLRETGGTSLVPISELGRRMILKSILQHEKKNLGLMGSLQNRPGFLSSLSEIISQLKTCRVSSGDLAGVAGGTGDGQLGIKLRDLARVYEKLNDRLAEGFTDPDDYLELLARQIPVADFFKGCRVWVDGFNFLTPQEYAVLSGLLTVAEDISVTLNLDTAAARSSLPQHHPFIKPREVYDRLKRLAGEAGATPEEIYLEPKGNWRFVGSPELAHLEQNYFKYPTLSYRGQVNKVSLAAGVNVRAEVEGVVRDIRRLLREQGLRPRQIMVAVRDVDVYFPLFRRALADSEIPFFIDHRRPVMHHPLVELLRSALLMWQAGWTFDAVFRYLKTGLVRPGREEVDRLENYVLAAGIRGSGWYSEQPWRFVPGLTWQREERELEVVPELEEINDIRWRAIGELRAAQRKIKESAEGRPGRLKGRDWARILLELCLELDIPRRLDRLSRESMEVGNPEVTREHRQVWGLVTGLWDELAEVLGEEKLTVAELSGVMDAGFEAMNLNLIPPGLDAVTVGSLDRSRPSREVLAFFIPGLTEGALPANPRSYGIFTEWEMEQLALTLALPPGATDRMHKEQFLIYRALTRTGERLCLSYPLGDDEGRAVTPSSVVRRVKELFPGIESKMFTADPPGGDADVEFVEHPAGLLPRLSLRWREAAWGEMIHPMWWRIYNLLVEREEWRESLAFIISGLTGRNIEASLGEELGLKLWSRKERKKRVMVSSVSRLEAFVKCPFSHFLSHGLGLEERAVYRLAPPDTGQLFHEAMRLFVEQVESMEAGWESLDDNRVRDICVEVVNTLAPRLQGRILLSSTRRQRQKERLLERIYDSARALARHIRSGNFRPAALEVYFGPRGRAAGPGELRPGMELQLPPPEIDLGESVRLMLSGRIDRLDLAVDNDALYLRVIDYKSGNEKLELPHVLAGTQIQLLVYLWVALEYFASNHGRGYRVVEPAGAFYSQVQRPVLSVNSPDVPLEDLEKEWLKMFKLNGLLVDHGQDFYRLLDKNLGPGVSSLTVPVALNKDGTLAARSAVACFSRVELQLLVDSLKELLARNGREIIRGRVDIAPLRSGRGTACDYCSYRPVCRFDLWLPENRYRSLNFDAGELRKKIRLEAAREGGAIIVIDTLDR